MFSDCSIKIPTFDNGLNFTHKTTRVYVQCIFVIQNQLMLNKKTKSSALSNFNRLFHLLFWIKRKQSVGVKGLDKKTKSCNVEVLLGN